MWFKKSWSEYIRWLAWAGLFTLLSTMPAFGGATLKGIQARGVLRCGVGENIPGFSERGPDGVWNGLDVEFCRAIAAATLGDGRKVRFKPLRSSERFPALKGGLIDVLLSHTTWTLGREVGLKVRFPGILFYDGQGFMVPADSPVRSAADLDGKRICLVKGSTHIQNTANFFAMHGWHYTPVIVASGNDALPLLLDGRCQVAAGDLSSLAARRLHHPNGIRTFRLLSEQIAREPLSPAVRDDDEEWISLVRWVLFVLIDAEENGVTRENIQMMVADKTDPGLAQSLEACRNFAASLGIRPEWAVDVIAAVGNYGEIFERTLGRKSPLGLERGLNRLWNQGGLLYAPPLR